MCFWKFDSLNICLVSNSGCTNDWMFKILQQGLAGFNLTNTSLWNEKNISEDEQKK